MTMRPSGPDPRPRRPGVRTRVPIRGIIRRLRAAAGGSDDERYDHLADVGTPALVRIPGFHVDATSSGPVRLNVLMPALQVSRMTGGPNTALNLTARLVDHGIRVRYISAHSPADTDLRPMRVHLERLMGRSIPADAIELADAVSPGPPVTFGPRDVVLATWWPTAHTAHAITLQTQVPEFIYLIQDYEPGFYSWSTNHALAAATYELPHRAIFNERLLQDFFRRRGVGRHGDGRAAAPSIAFEPAVDRSLFRPPAKAGRRAGRRRLLFYARPRNERNLFELGLRALRQTAGAGALSPERWEVRSIGHALPAFALAPGLVMKNTPWMDYRSYANYLGGSSLLLSLMLSPHTSYPPLEMAACGGAVVTNTFEVKTAAALHALSPAIQGVPPDPDSISSALAEAITRLERGEAGDGSLSAPGSWGEALEESVAWLATNVRELAAGR
jgi:O-antigen biosynthesis protein